MKGRDKPILDRSLETWEKHQYSGDPNTGPSVNGTIRITDKSKAGIRIDRKSTRLNSSHGTTSRMHTILTTACLVQLGSE